MGIISTILPKTRFARLGLAMLVLPAVSQYFINFKTFPYMRKSLLLQHFGCNLNQCCAWLSKSALCLKDSQSHEETIFANRFSPQEQCSLRRRGASVTKEQSRERNASLPDIKQILTAKCDNTNISIKLQPQCKLSLFLVKP